MFARKKRGEDADSIDPLTLTVAVAEQSILHLVEKLTLCPMFTIRSVLLIVFDVPVVQSHMNRIKDRGGNADSIESWWRHLP